MEGKDLRNVGLKVTSPRLKILEVLETSVERHLSAEDIYRALLDNGHEFGLATVYRVLAQFEGAGLVSRVYRVLAMWGSIRLGAGLVSRHNFEGGMSVFELADRSHHDHMVCLETGKVIEFVEEQIERLQAEIADRHGYTIEDHSLVLYVRPKAS